MDSLKTQYVVYLEYGLDLSQYLIVPFYVRPYPHTKITNTDKLEEVRTNEQSHQYVFFKHYKIHYKYADINATSVLQLCYVTSLVVIMYYRIYSQEFVEFTGADFTNGLKPGFGLKFKT